MTAALTEFVSLLVAGITQLGSGLAAGVNSYVEALFIKSASGAVTGLSTFGGVLAVFAGVSLAIGITTLVFNFVKSLGN